jgi:amino acid adenylation domain-containing protein
MSISELLHRIKENNIDISLQGADLRLNSDTANLPVDLIADIRKSKQLLIDYLSNAGAAVSEGLKIPPAPHKEVYELSSAQRRIWMLSHYEEASLAYNITGAYHLKDRLNAVAFEHAINVLIKRHEILRTVFRMNDNGDIHQHILAEENAAFRIGVHRSENTGTLKHLMENAYAKPFDLSVFPLLKIDLYALDDGTEVLSYNIHHIISDGWSMEILIRELFTLYNAHLSGIETPLAHLPFQYKDFSEWETLRAGNGAFDKAKQYWREKFQGEMPVFDINVNKTRPPVKTYNGRTIRSNFDSHDVRQFKAICTTQHASLYMGLLSVVYTLLYRIAGCTDIIVGSPIAGRNFAGAEEQLGCFTNTIPLRMQIDGKTSFTSFLDRVKEMTLEAYAFEAYPFDMLIEGLNIRRDGSRNPLFEVEVLLQGLAMSPVAGNEAAEDVFLESFNDCENRHSKFDLSFYFVEVADTVQLILEYNTDVYEEYVVRKLADGVAVLLKNIVADKQAALNAYTYISGTEKERLLQRSAGRSEMPAGQSVLEMFSSIVAAKGDHVALIAGDAALTYRELDDKSDRLASCLVGGRALKRGFKAVFLMDRSPGYLIAMIGVWKAGGCFIPLNPEMPAERNMAMAKEINYDLVIVGDSFTSAAENLFPDQYLTLDQALAAGEHLAVLPQIQSDDIAYVIFTSGSTGGPKAAAVLHKGMLNHMLAKIEDFGITENDTIAQTATQTFDVSIWQFMTALLVGGKTAVFAGEEAWEPSLLLAGLNRHKVTIFESVPSHFSILLDFIASSPDITFNHLRCLMMNGEILLAEYCNRWFRYFPNIPVANVYGPTECSDDITHFTFNSCQDKWGEYVPIGYPVRNMSLYVLDEQLHMLPEGIAGDLYTCGIGVGAGYLNDPTKTAATFIDNPFKREGFPHETKLYKTGDVACYLPDGPLQFIGRRDSQVKIRGNRVELGEIDAAIHVFDGVVKHIVMVRINEQGDNYLVAYIVSGDGFSKTGLIAGLRNRLPDYMVPQVIVLIPDIPLLANGKVNKNELPEPAYADLILKEFISPRNSIEEELVSIWKTVLGIDNIGVHDGFFDLGGNSLLLMKIQSAITRIFSVPVPIGFLFQHDIENIAKYIMLRQPEPASDSNEAAFEI